MIKILKNHHRFSIPTLSIREKDYCEASITAIIYMLVLVVIILASAGGLDAQASIIPTPTGGSCPPGTGQCGNFGVNDFVSLAGNVARFIWGISGALALLFLIYGGLTFLISMGNSDKVARARQIIFNSIAGLIIVFCSWMIINFVFVKLGAKNATTWSQGTSPQ